MKGYLACFLCGLDMETRCSSHLKKNVYLGHYCYFGKSHPYRRNCVTFNGEPQLTRVLASISFIDFLKRAKECKWLTRRMWSTIDKDDPIHMHGVKRKKYYVVYHIGR